MNYWETMSGIQMRLREFHLLYFFSLQERKIHISEIVVYWIVAFAAIPFHSLRILYIALNIYWNLRWWIIYFKKKKKKKKTNSNSCLFSFPIDSLWFCFDSLYIYGSAAALDIFSFLLISVIRISLEIG